MTDDRIKDMEEKVEILREAVQNLQEDLDQLAENVESGLGHAEAHAIEQAKQEIAEEYSLVEGSGAVSGTSDSPEAVAYVLRHECDRGGVRNQTLVWASSQFPHRCNGCEDLLDESYVHKTLVERSETGDSSMTQDERDTGTFLDEIPTHAYTGEARNDDGRLVSVLRWHFEGDDIERNKQALVQREMAAYAIKRELKNVRDLLLEVADQPDVETYKEHVRGALGQRIKELEEGIQ